MNFQKKLSSGKFVVLAEMNPPKGVDISGFVTNARRIQGRVDAAVIPDMDNGVMKMSAIGGGALISRQGIEPIMHLYGRDRNRMALQGDILAASVLGISNFIVVPGEQIAKSDHREAKTVDDLDEISLIKAAQSLKNGLDMSGFELKSAPDITIGCAMSPYGDEKQLDIELQSAAKKIEAGASFIISPYLFDIQKSASFFEKANRLGVPVIPTVFLLKSVGIARYMSNYEPGAAISDELIKRIRKSPNRETECLKIAGETIAALKQMAQGVKIQTLGWERRLPEILDFAGI